MKSVMGLIVALLLPLALQGQQKSSVIGPGDLVAVSIFSTPEFDQRVRITDAGELPLISGGKVKVLGLTPEQAARAIEDALIHGQLLVDPKVILTVEQYAARDVVVSGEVKSPGVYPVETGRSLPDVLALAGGLTDSADPKITIERGQTHERLSIHFSNTFDQALTEQVTVYPGDKVIVPKAEVVYVLGDVARPGRYPTTDLGLTVVEAVFAAGGTPRSAVPSNTRLIRRHADGTWEEVRVPFSDIRKGKKPDIPLEANDILYVPFSYGRNAAVGVAQIIAAAAGGALYHF